MRFVCFLPVSVECILLMYCVFYRTFSVSWALHLSLFIIFHITHKWQIKISWFLIYDLHYSHNSPVCGPLDQDQLSNNFLVTSPQGLCLSQLLSAVCYLIMEMLSWHWEMLLFSRQSRLITCASHACINTKDTRCADTQMKLFAAFSHDTCQAD